MPAITNSPPPIPKIISVQQRHRIDPFPGQGAGDGSRHQQAAEQPVAGVGVRHPAGLDAEAAARPGGGVGDHIHRAHPAAEQPPADQQVKTSTIAAPISADE